MYFLNTIITNILTLIALYVMCHLVVTLVRGNLRYNKIMYSYHIVTEEEKKFMYRVKKLMFEPGTSLYALFLMAMVFGAYAFIMAN